MILLWYSWYWITVLLTEHHSYTWFYWLGDNNFEGGKWQAIAHTTFQYKLNKHVLKWVLIVLHSASHNSITDDSFDNVLIPTSIGRSSPLCIYNSSDDTSKSTSTSRSLLEMYVLAQGQGNIHLMFLSLAVESVSFSTD